MKLEDVYGRPAALKFLNGLSKRISGLPGVTPTTNMVGLYQKMQRVIGYLSKAAPHTVAVIEKIVGVGEVQESGKADLLYAFPRPGKLPLAMAVEVKAAAQKLTRGALRDNQIEWAESTTWGSGYYIFLWFCEDAEPNLRTKVGKSHVHAYFIPLNAWLSAWTNIVEQCNVETLPYTAALSGRKAVRAGNFSVAATFGEFELAGQSPNFELPAGWEARWK